MNELVHASGFSLLSSRSVSVLGSLFGVRAANAGTEREHEPRSENVEA
jgi:hypothetical protein